MKSSIFLLDLGQVPHNHLLFAIDLVCSIPSQRDHDNNIPTRIMLIESTGVTIIERRFYTNFNIIH